MAFHVAAWYESLDQAVLAPIAAVADPALTVAGDNIQVPNFGNYLMGAFSNAGAQTRMQLQAPSLRRVINYEVRPLNSALVADLFDLAVDLMHNPIPLDISEQMQCFAAEGGAGANLMVGIALLGDGKVDAITDPIYSVRATAAITTVAGTWINGAMVFDQVLPVGTYAIVGAREEEANAIAFRFVFQGSTPRPGGVGVNTIANREPKGQRFGGWGVWGIFDSTTPPTLDVLAGGVDASQVLTLDLIKVS